MKLKATIEKIEKIDNLKLITLKSNSLKFIMMSLEFHKEVGEKVIISIKPTSVSLAKNFSGEMSCLNEFKGIVKNYELGEIVCRVEVESGGEIFESIISKKAFEKMSIKKDDEVTIFIRENEITAFDTN